MKIKIKEIGLPAIYITLLIVSAKILIYRVLEKSFDI